MATEDEDLNDLEREIESTDGADEPKEEDFELPEGDTGADDDDSAVEPDTEPAAAARAPEISDDLDNARAQAAQVAQQWEAYLADKDEKLADARKKLSERMIGGYEADDLVEAQEALQVALIEKREAESGAANARDYLARASQPRSPAAQAWIDKNPRFKTDAAFRERAMKIAAQLEQQDGYNPAHARLFQELDKRMKTKTPMGNRNARTGGAPTSRQPVRSGNDASTPSAFDRKWMRNVGLDPSNKAHFSEWKRNYNDLVAEA